MVLTKASQSNETLAKQGTERTIVTALGDHVRTGPDRVFVTVVERDSRQNLTFGALDSGSRRIAAALMQAGVPHGSVVVIMLKHGVALYTTFMGAMFAGFIPSFMPCPTPKQKPELFWSSHRALFARIQPGAIIVSADLEMEVRAAAPEGTIILELGGMSAPSGDLAPELNAPEAAATDVAFLQHSSGTTSLKKGVMLTHAAVLEQVSSYADTIAFDSRSVIASWLPLYHDMGLIACFMLPLVVGAQIIHIDAIAWVGSPLTLLQEIEAARATHAWMPNFAFNHMTLARRRAPGKRWDLSTMKALINCSEPCKSESMQGFAAAYADCGIRPDTPQVCYAMAETVFAVTQTRLGHPVTTIEVDRDCLTRREVALSNVPDRTQTVVACGSTIPGAIIKIVDEAGVELAENVVGEIWATGASLYNGYYKLPDVTAERLQDGWHRTGDLGFLHQGELFVTGRVDDLIIIRGRNFYAHDLEAIASAIPGVRPGRTIVFAMTNAALGTAEVICLIEPVEGAPLLDVKRAVKAAVESLSGLVLTRVICVARDSLHKTTSGKISREQNSKAFVGGTLITLEQIDA